MLIDDRQGISLTMVHICHFADSLLILPPGEATLCATFYISKMVLAAIFFSLLNRVRPSRKGFSSKGCIFSSQKPQVN